MTWIFTLFSLPSAIAALTALITAVLAWRRRPARGALPLSLAALAVTIWSVGYVLVLNGGDLYTKFFWMHMQYVGIAATTPLLLIFALQYAGYKKPLKPVWLVLQALPPAAGLWLVFTNPISGGLVWNHLALTRNFYYLALDLTFGPAWWAIIGYSYLVLLVSMLVLLSRMVRSAALYRRQLLVVMLAYLAPWITSVLYVTRHTPLYPLDYTPLVFGVSFLVYLWAFYGLRLLEIVPAARDAVIEGMNDGVVVLDLRGRMLDLNPAARRILSIPSGGIGKPAGEVFANMNGLDPEFFHHLEANVEVELDHDQKQCFDLRLLPLMDERGDLSGRLLVLRDITERQLAEEALRESERRYRLLAGSASDVIWTLDLSGKFTYVSPSVEQLRGYTPEEVLNQKLEDAFSPDSLAVVQSGIKAIADGIQAGQHMERRAVSEVEQPCKNGSSVWTEVITSVMYNEDGSFAGILGVTRDITERKKVEQAESEQRLLAEALERAGKALSGTLDFDEVLDRILEQIGYVVPNDVAFVLLLEDRYVHAIRVKAGPEYPPNSLKFLMGIAHELDKVPNYRSMFNTHQPMVIPDVNNHAEWRQLPGENILNVRSWVGAPIVAREHVVGFLTMDKREPFFYNQRHAQILGMFAGQAALAMENARLFQDAQKRATEAETLHQAAAAVAATLNMDEAIQLILEQLQRVVPYDSSTVQLLRGENFEVVGGRGFSDPKAVIGLSFPIAGHNPGAAVYRMRKPLILEDVRPLYSAFLEPPHNHIRSWLGVPLVVQERIIGLIALDSTEPAKFTEDDARLAAAFGDQVAIALENTRLYAEAQRMAVTDALTGLYNRRHFYSLCIQEMERSRRYRHTLSLIMLDIDHFKRVNDTAGHAAGDRVLQAICELMRQQMRVVDILARYGGEEFVILLPETTLDSATLTAERLCERIKDLTVSTPNGSVSVTASIGVTTLTNWPTTGSLVANYLDHLINQADQAMYAAKEAGRNQIAIYQEK